MSKYPLLNAFVALIYIILIVLFISFVFDTETNVGIGQYVVPIMFISIFTLSAATMGYIFGLEPFKLYLDGKRKEAIALFIKTTVAFAVLIVIFFILYFFFIVGF